jgi:hypothetical protein
MFEFMILLLFKGLVNHIHGYKNHKEKRHCKIFFLKSLQLLQLFVALLRLIVKINKSKAINRENSDTTKRH